MASAGRPRSAESTPLARGQTILGRGSDCAVTIEDPLVSRHHASIDVDGDRADVPEHHGEVLLGARAAAAYRHVDPAGRLAVDLAAADGPVQQVLQAAGQRASVFGGAEQQRTGRRDPRSQVRRRARRPLVLVGAERGQRREPVVQLRRDPGGRQRLDSPQRCRVARPAPGAAGNEQDPHVCHPLNLS
jgi:hypothetical protein